MNSTYQFEHSASRSRVTDRGESSPGLCDRLSRTRDFSQRQLPTDHDYAVPTREYQTDQSSLLSDSAAADPVLKTPNHPTHPQSLTGSLHISPGAASQAVREFQISSPTAFLNLCPLLNRTISTPHQNAVLGPTKPVCSQLDETKTYNLNWLRVCQEPKSSSRGLSNIS